METTGTLTAEHLEPKLLKKKKMEKIISPKYMGYNDLFDF